MFLAMTLASDYRTNREHCQGAKQEATQETKGDDGEDKVDRNEIESRFGDRFGRLGNGPSRCFWGLAA